MEAREQGSRAVVERLARSINAHDLEAFVGCFTDDVESVQPVHPARRFRGREQIRRNWTQLFAEIPDLHATLLELGGDGKRTFAEWHWSGTRPTGDAFEMRGVTIQEIVDDRIAAVRLYMEPVEVGGAAIDAVIRDTVGR